MMLFLLAFLLLCSAFSSLSEMALVALSKLRLRHMVAQKVRNAALLDRLVKRIDDVIASLVVANNFINVAVSSLGAWAFSGWIDSRRSARSYLRVTVIRAISLVV